jgi:hypothetical protein
VTRRPAVAAIGLAAALAAPALGGCQSDCCTVDSFPILLGRAASGAPPLDGGVPDAGSPDADGGVVAASLPDAGALWALASLPGGDPSLKMVVDTASPLTFLNGATGGQFQTSPTGFDLYSQGLSGSPLRAQFPHWDVLTLPLQPIGDGSLVPDGVLGADVLRSYSVELRFAAPCPAGMSGTCAWMTLWNRLAPDQAFLEDAGYAVLNFTPYGGGEVTANGEPDSLGTRGPLAVPATRVVLRGCAVPAAFSPKVDPAGPLPPACCTAADALAQATGVDLSLLVDTGIGPLVLSASAWARVVANAAARTPPLVLPVPGAGAAPTPLHVATWPSQIPVLLWTSIPRYALVNLEAGNDNDPGPCVELARARRTEVVSFATANKSELHLCTQPCDLDPNQSGEAQNSAAYLEIDGAIPVAVISDDDAFLQGLRFDVLPEGPEVDGLVGATALGAARLELDYLSSPARAVFSCEAGVPPTSCRATARCPQLPDPDAQHDCFGLGFHKVPSSCAPSNCSR